MESSSQRLDVLAPRRHRRLPSPTSRLQPGAIARPPGLHYGKGNGCHFPWQSVVCEKLIQGERKMPPLPRAGRALGKEARMGPGWQALSCRPGFGGGDNPGAGDALGPGGSVTSPQPGQMKAASPPQIGRWWGKMSHPALFVPGPALCHGNSKRPRSLLPALGAIKANCADDAGGSCASWRGISRVTPSRRQRRS